MDSDSVSPADPADEPKPKKKPKPRKRLRLKAGWAGELEFDRYGVAAERLHLTPIQRRFAEAYIRTGSRSKAAIAAREDLGRNSRHAPTAYAAVLMKNPNVNAYISLLQAEAMRLANDRSAGAVATREEALLAATQVLRQKLGDLIQPDGTLDIEAIRNAPPGVVKRYSYVASRKVVEGEATEKELERAHVETESVLAAAKTVIEAHDAAEGRRGAASPINLLAILQRAGDVTPAGAMRLLLSGPGDVSNQAIDAEAKRIE